MKQIIIYDENDCIVEVLSKVQNIQIEGKTISWSNGKLSDIQRDFLIVDNQEEIQVGDYLNNYNLIVSTDDFRSESQKKDEEILMLQKENASLIMDSMQKDIAIQQGQSDHAALMMDLVIKGVI